MWKYGVDPSALRLLAESCLLALCGALAALGYGTVLARILRIRPNLGDRGVLGLLAFGFIACVAHFAIALSAAFQIAVLAGGMVLAGVFRREIQAASGIGRLAAAALFVFVLLHPQSLHHYDDGLYHLQTLKWNTQLPITPGLGNLHGRLAFNSMLFLIAPVTDRMEIGWIANYLLLGFVLASFLARKFNWFPLLALAFFVAIPDALAWLGILNTDGFAAVLIVYWVALAMDRDTEPALLILAAVLAAAVKISALPLLALAAIWCWRARASVGRAATVGGLVLATLMLRGMVLSGCALYPVRQTCVSSLPWAETAGQVDDEALSIRAFARRPGDLHFVAAMQDWSWLAPWLSAAIRQPLVDLLIAGVLLGAAGAALRKPPGDVGWLALGLAGCLFFWFFTAPDIRFGAGFLFAAALLGISVAAARLPGVSLARTLLIIAMVLSSVQQLGRVRVRRDYFFYKIPQASVYQLAMADGARLWVPRNRDQCWLQDLPCTPYVDSAALARIRWRARWPYHNDPASAPPAGWTPMRGVNLYGR